MGEVQSQESPRMVVGYSHREGRPMAELLTSGTQTPPPVRVLVLALVVGLFPLTFPFAAWAAVQYWRAPLSQWRWRWVSIVLLGLGLFNLVGLLAYGYGRHFTIF